MYPAILSFSNAGPAVINALIEGIILRSRIASSKRFLLRRNSSYHTVNFKPNVVVVTLQSEVAKRIVASPGDMSVLAVSVQFYGLPQLMGRIPSGAFYPRPESDSCIVRIDLYDNFQVPVSDADGFFRVVKAGFGQRRKQLQNALSSGLGIERDHVASALLDAGIDPRRRAQTLALEEWALIHEHLPVAF